MVSVLLLSLVISIRLLSSNGLDLHNYTTCNNSGTIYGKVHTISVDPCVEEPCTIAGGRSYKIETAFTSHIDSAFATVAMQASIRGEDFPLDFPPQDACKSNTKCPIVAGKWTSYTAWITGVSIETDAEVRWALKGESNKTIICVVAPFVLTDY